MFLHLIAKYLLISDFSVSDIEIALIDWGHIDQKIDLTFPLSNKNVRNCVVVFEMVAMHQPLQFFWLKLDCTSYEIITASVIGKSVLTYVVGI